MTSPLVSCLCPTYGRYGMLRQALACFLAQAYEPKELIILNDHPTPIRCDYPGVRVVNAPERYVGLGRKRQALLDLAEGEYAAHWDDDDLYLPWHLSHWLPVLQENCPKGLLQVYHAWSARGILGNTDNPYRVRYLHINAYQSQHIYNVATARELGYGTSYVIETRMLHGKFVAKRLRHLEAGPPWCSMIYAWGDGLSHGSVAGESREGWERYAAMNQDVSEKPLTPADLARQFRAWRAFVVTLKDEDYSEPLAIIDGLLKGG